MVNKYLISKGHQVRVLLQQANMYGIDTPYMYDGVEVMPPSGQLDAYRWADVICTHLDLTQFTMIMANEAKKPLVHFVHNDIEYSSIVNGIRGQYVVYNSEWTKEKIGYKWPSMILHPPCDAKHYNVCEDPEKNEFITMVSLNVNKGGKILYQLAEAMPHKKFMGVVGSYDTQFFKVGGGLLGIEPSQIKDSNIDVSQLSTENVTIVPNGPDIQSVYKKTRVLLMPSAYESWGRTATEAMCSGIPVVCTPTPGLKENCGDAAVYIPPRLRSVDDTGGTVTSEKPYELRHIIKAIEKLDNKKFYAEMSEKGRKRAAELDPNKELEQVEQFILNATF